MQCCSLLPLLATPERENHLQAALEIVQDQQRNEANSRVFSPFDSTLTLLSRFTQTRPGGLL